MAPGHGFQGGDRDAGPLQPPAEALGGGNTDADAGKAAGPVGIGHQIDVPGGQIAVVQQILGQLHQGAAVGLTAVLIIFSQQASVLQEGHGHRLGGGFKGNQLHQTVLRKW